MHFALLDRRLRVWAATTVRCPRTTGCGNAARDTAHDVAARLAVVPMVLEARGLDVTPMTIERFARRRRRARRADPRTNP